MPARRPILTYGLAALTIAAGLVIGVAVGRMLVGPTTTPGLSGAAAPGAHLAESTPATFPAPAGQLDAPADSVRQPTAATPIAFDVSRALATIRALEEFGPRKGGSAAEFAAARWLQQQLGALGYEARLESVVLTDGSTSHNVIARAEGSSPRVIVLGAHYDTKPPSPGANDNASGCGALLEIARILAGQPVTPTVEFVFFGAEEIIDGDPDHHHFGSRARVAAMSADERAATAGMISIDMIGYGPEFHSRTMLRGPRGMSDLVLAQAAASGVRMTFLKDPGASGWSDHEAYELAGIPATWIEWRDDPVYHTAKDTSGHLDSAKIRTAGQLVLDVLRSLDANDLETLVAR